MPLNKTLPLSYAQRIDKETAQAEQFWTKQAASDKPLLAYTGRFVCVLCICLCATCASRILLQSAVSHEHNFNHSK